MSVQDVDDLTCQKATDVRRRYPSFEILWKGVIMFEVSATDDGAPRITFHEGVGGKRFRLEKFEATVARCMRWLSEEMNQGD